MMPRVRSNSESYWKRPGRPRRDEREVGRVPAERLLLGDGEDPVLERVVEVRPAEDGRRRRLERDALPVEGRPADDLPALADLSVLLGMQGLPVPSERH